MRSNIRKNIPVQIGHHDYVKCFGGVGHFGGTDVDDPVLVFDFGVFFGYFIKHLVKQAIGLLHDVVFGETGYFFSAVLLRVFKCVAYDLFTAWAADQFQALHHFVGLLVFDPGIQVFFVFADDHDVHFRVLRFHKRVQTQTRPYVGVKSQELAGGYIQTLVAAALRSGDWRFQENLVFANDVPGFFGNSCRVASQVNFFTHFDFVYLNLGASCHNDFEGRVHDFRTNSVAFCYGDSRHCFRFL